MNLAPHSPGVIPGAFLCVKNAPGTGHFAGVEFSNPMSLTAGESFDFDDRIVVVVTEVLDVLYHVPARGNRTGLVVFVYLTFPGGADDFDAANDALIAVRILHVALRIVSIGFDAAFRSGNRLVGIRVLKCEQRTQQQDALNQFFHVSLQFSLAKQSETIPDRLP